MRWHRVLRAWVSPLVLLTGLGLAGLGATSVARLPPAPSKQSRARDTPVVNHLPGGGPDGGHVHSLAIVATQPPTVYAAFRRGGVYASTDRGTTWTPVDRGLPPTGWCDLVADPVSTSTLYAACFDSLFKTTNGGALWRQLDVDNPQPPVVAPSNPKVVYQPPDRGLVRSLDGGRRWKTVAVGSAVPWRCSIAFVVDPLDASRLYCSDERWLSVSRDGGLTWKAATGAHPDAELSAIAIDPSDRNTMLVATSDGRTFKTTTGGKHWFAAGDAPGKRELDELRFTSHPGVVYAREDERLLRSSDGAAHWETVFTAWANFDFDFTFVVDPVSPDTIYAGTSQGVMVTTDGGQHWAPRNRGITRATASVVFHEGSTASLFASAGRDVFTSQDDGATWALVPFESELTGLDPALLSSDGAGGVLFRTRAEVFHLARSARTWTREVVPAGAQTHGNGYRSRILTTTTGFVYSSGGEWRAATALPNGVVPHAIVAAGPPGTLFASSGGILSMIKDRSGIWRSDDDGRTWRLIHQPNTHGIGRCCGLMADPNDRNTIYAIVASVGIGGGGDIVSRTTDAGLTWTEVKVPGLSRAFELVPTVPTTIIAQLYGAGLVRSTDGGDQWSAVGSGLPDGIEITNVAFDRRRPTTLFAGTTNRGVYRSTDTGATWQPTDRGGKSRE